MMGPGDKARYLKETLRNDSIRLHRGLFFAFRRGNLFANIAVMRTSILWTSTRLGWCGQTILAPHHELDAHQL